jgi:HEAT repeat protein
MQSALLQGLASRYQEDPDVSRESMHKLLRIGGAEFSRAAFGALAESLGPGEQYLLCLMLLAVKEEAVLSLLLDTNAVETERARQLAHSLGHLDPNLGPKVLKYAVDESRREERIDSSIERALELLTILPDARSNSTFLLELLRSPDPRVRSKATLLMARSNRMPRWAEVRLAEPDPRVRANAVEGLWNLREPGTEQVLRAATQDPHHRVAVNAWIGLYYLGDPQAVEGLLHLASDELPLTRSAAAWGMGHLGESVFQPTLQQLVRDADPAVRRNALRSLVKIKKKNGTAAEQTEDPLPLEAAR